MAADTNNENAFRSMQQEAVRRVNEMYRRSREMVGQPQRQERPPSPPPAPPPSVPADRQPKTPDQPISSLSGLLSAFNIDEEKALIGILIYVLAKNGADVKLLLGLGYLLL